MCNLPHTMCMCCMYINAWQTLDFGIPSTKQALYQPVINCTYWPVLGSYNNWNIVELTPKSIPFEAFDEIHNLVLDRISENMASLVQSGMYGDINTAENTWNGFYLIQFISEAYTLQKIQQSMDKLFMLLDYLSSHNIFAPCKKTPIGIENNNHCKIPS